MLLISVFIFKKEYKLMIQKMKQNRKPQTEKSILRLTDTFDTTDRTKRYS